jgi:hypothetical protein
MRGNRTRKGAGSLASTRRPPRTLRLLQPRPCCSCWLLSSGGQKWRRLYCVGGKWKRRRERVEDDDDEKRLMGSPGLLAKARPTKASSIEARQYSGADTRVECTHALQGTGREGGREGIQKPSVSPSSRSPKRLQGGNAKRRVLEGGSSMRPSTEKAIRMNARNRRISRLKFSGSCGKFGPRSGEQWSSLVDDSARGDGGHGDPRGDPR